MIKENAMTAPKSTNPAQVLREQAESASPDVLRAMVKTFADALVSAEADAICGAPYGQRSDERTNQPNGYRAWEWDTRAGTTISDAMVVPDESRQEKGQVRLRGQARQYAGRAALSSINRSRPQCLRAAWPGRS
jgi:Transposase, Mutator family